VAAYRRERRADGKDNPRKPRRWDTDGHVPARWFRDTIIKPALKEAGLPVDIRMHLLRHAHASWLLNGGADLMVVKERLGHASILTTERYLHTVDNADVTALGALDKIRDPRGRSPEATESIDMRTAISQGRGPLSNEELLAQMAALQAELTKRLGGGDEGASAALAKRRCWGGPLGLPPHFNMTRPQATLSSDARLRGVMTDARDRLSNESTDGRAKGRVTCLR
jgi:hypothetical protein